MSDLSYQAILKQFEELYPQASGEVLAAAARCEVNYTQPSMAAIPKDHSKVIDIRTHAATLRRARQ